MITSDAQLHQAQTDVQTLWCFLEAARATHTPLDYQRLAAPYLLQLQERQHRASLNVYQALGITQKGLDALAGGVELPEPPEAT